MSTEIQFDTVACPKCASRLLTERVDDVAVLCANCRTAFVPDGRRTMPRTSRKAVASLVLGLLSPAGLFLTGVPAIWLGLSACRQIGRAPRALKGRYLAIGGVASGTIFGLLWGGCAGASGAFGLAVYFSTTETVDAQAAGEIAGRLADFEAPRGTEPLEALELGVLGTRTVVYGRDPRPDNPLVILMQIPQGTVQQIQGTILNKDGRNGGPLEVVESEELRFTIRSQSVTVFKTVGVDGARGDRFRQYIAVIPKDGTMLLAALVTPDASRATPERETVSLTEDEVREFFESIR